ncbi:dipeptidase [Pseudomonas benzenivorans]|uniref:Membrane dipeptidase n=1 Tax=Pseudomonas benzenivorans TaxID=556533 RepID=A0ABY5H9D0_9PSED|nr:membrane dipeptidase [Pseudomonas benzenivorans]UTW08223.1 membrane dipeptidase [Pseudomonas benzenivorans]
MIQSASLVWDAHAGIFPSPTLDLKVLEDWSANHVDYVSINVGFDVMTRDETLATLAAYRHGILAQQDRYVLAGTMAEVRAAKESGRLAVSFDLEGINALGGDVNMVGVYHALGVRQMLFAYNLSNAAAGGCHDEDTGLTAYGSSILAEMNRLGIIVDASHAGFRTSMDLMEQSQTPVVFSHSNPGAVLNHQRNINDVQIKACAQQGGVIGLNGLGIFLGNNDISPETMLRHLFYLFDLVGPAHVGLGFDSTPGTEIDLSVILRARPDFWPQGQQYDTPHIGHGGPSCIPDLIKGMQARGLTDGEIAGVLGENFARVASAVWK